MAKVKGIYKCSKCGNIIEVFADGGGVLQCCNQDMELLVENTVDAAKEKHVPVIEKTDKGYKVKVGQVTHPMTEEHYIQFIEIQCDCCHCVKILTPQDAPEAEFDCQCSEDKVSARQYCNLHGLWKA